MNRITHLTNSRHRDLADPAMWWRVLCWITERLIVTGDLSDSDGIAERQISEWIGAGVTHVVDVREESNDRRRMAWFAPQIEYIYAPTHDDGGGQPDSWFSDTVGRIVEILASDPEAVVLIHCHMGVNRAPSMAMAVLMDLGYSEVEALDMIRSGRPIAGILYADQVVDWFHRRQGSSDEVRLAAIDTVNIWHDHNPVDVGWIISRINRRDSADLNRDLGWYVGGDRDGDAGCDDDGAAA